MARHLIRRLGHALLTLVVISFVIHAALDVAPGDAADALAGETASAEQMAALREQLGLDGSSLQRYAGYVGGIVLRGDWGRSMASDRSVGRLLVQRLPNSLVLAGAAMVVATLVGGALGILAAFHAGKLLDALIIAGTAIGMASPTYWTALLLFWAFALRLNWLPVLAGDGLDHLILPVITLALPLSASVTRFVRVNVLDEMGRRYVDTARAKGATERRVVLRHVLRNALGPVVTLVGMHLGHLLGGTFVVETIYAWPGLGGLMVQAIFDRDHPVVMGTGLLIAAGYVLINLATDLVHGKLDPRIAR
jgi:ABC-type dipeptide/oligopeptide/nickel transport system permease component